MKKSYLMMAAAATMLAACTQSDFVNEVPTEAPKAIAFENGFVNKTTRSENSSSNYTLKFSDHHGNFNVWGYKNNDTEPVFNEKTVNVTLGQNAGSEIYTYNGLVYWDESADSYHFYAAAPAEHDWEFKAPDNADKSNGYFKTEITLDNKRINLGAGSHLESLKPQADELAADEYNQDLLIAAPCTPIIGQTVGMEFIHILSRLNIVVSKKGGMTEEVRTYKVGIYNMNMSGSFDESTPVDELEKGSYARWSNQNNLGNYIAERAEGAEVQEDVERYVIQTLVVPQAAEYQKVNLKGEDENGNELSASSKPYLYIEYGVENGVDTNGNKTYEKFRKYYNLAQIFGVTEGKTLPFYEGWENTLTLTIGPNSIGFKASVATWAAGTTTESSLN